MRIVVLLVVVLATQTAWAADVNLAPNPGLELLDDGLPTGWAPLFFGVPAQFHADEDVLHGGTCSVRLDAAEITRSYLRSGPIAVAAGEVVEISAWVKSRDVPPDQGTIILIAEFSTGDYKGQVGKVATADRSPDWQHLTGRVTIPAGCDSLRIRMGLSYSQGTTWWDDVCVCAIEPLVARVDADEERLYPAEEAIPLILLNRTGRTGPIDITGTFEGKEFRATVTLSGTPEQRVNVRLQIDRRGKVGVTISLFDPRTGEKLWSSKPLALTIPLPLVLLPPIPTHWAVEDGPPKIQVELELALAPGRQGRQPVRIDLIDDRSRLVWTRDLTGIPESGRAAVDLEPGQLKVGRYRLVAAVGDDSAPAVTAEQPWGVLPRDEASTRLNAEGFLEKQGKAVFPLGMFNNTARLKEEAEAGFNVAHFYNAARVRAGQRPDDQRLANAMNQCHAVGMHVLLMVPQGFATEGDWDAFTRRIRMFRNHPALLAWDEEEGLARGDMNLETLQRIRAILREEDPHHPLMVGDARDVIGRITDRANLFPVSEMDLGMWWWYPFPLKPSQGDALQGQDATGGLLLAPPTFLTQRTTEKPIWVGVQAYKKRGADGRYPTPAEYRTQAYLAMIHGAKGLMWYGGSVTGGAFLDPKKAHWAELKQVVSELRDLTPVLLGQTETVVVHANEMPVDATVKRTGSRRVLVAVNRGPDPCTTSFEIHNLPTKAVCVIGEEREIVPEAGRITDRYEPYSAHVYELDP